MFSVVRGYNIAIIVLAQYLAAFYIFAPQKPISEILFDPYLFLIVFASSLAIASGYIINNFYDAEKDLINRPHKTLLDNYLNQQTKLSVYFLLNLLVVILASTISFRAVAFFSIYIFFLWFYSHKLKKYPLIGNIASTILAITPFFAVFIYYKNFETIIFVHATYLILVLFMLDLTKDLENIKGDFAQDYGTIPVKYGIKLTKIIISISFFFTFIPIYFLLQDGTEIGYMVFYFLISEILLLLFTVFLWFAKTTFNYALLHLSLKLILILGVFSILLIDLDTLLHKML